jgi:hypothetical protein
LAPVLGIGQEEALMTTDQRASGCITDEVREDGVDDVLALLDYGRVVARHGLPTEVAA